MQDFLNKNILVGITGGIAAFKSAYLVRELMRLGATVRVLMTPSSTEFITPMTMQALSGHEVRCELFDSQAERAMGHIELARWADYVVIAPASANCIAKMAHGLADDLLSTLYLVTEVPVVLCPAMNQSMWKHAATQANCQILKQRGLIFVGPENGEQACGEQGYGRLSETESIITALRLCDMKTNLKHTRFLITAGPTREAIDPVRYITNHSSGKMGYALAEAAKFAGAEVILISGPTNLAPPLGVTCHYTETADDMLLAVERYFEPGMVFIGAAAVADYKMAVPGREKLKRQGRGSMTIELVATTDILSTIVASQQAAYTVGFAAETQDVYQHALEKLNRKQVDMVIANEVGKGLGFDVDDNQVILLTQDGTIELPRAHKTKLAAQIIAILADKLQN
jgi:phosphopantothenoylcysteine decarboxylase/phosphopantothenate--cysteine ligase